MADDSALERLRGLLDTSKSVTELRREAHEQARDEAFADLDRDED